MFSPKLLFPAIALVCAQSSLAADSNAGKAFFGQQCALCHSAEPGDNGGAQGPLLHDIFGREAATGNFNYTRALQDADLSWDAETLDRFLANPVATVPGTSMVVPIDDAEARENVIAYFEALAEGSYAEPERRGGGFGGFGANSPLPDQSNADWKNDRPGRVHRVDLDALPEPFETDSAMNFPRVVERPEGAEMLVPEGFKVETFATDLTAPRAMITADNGDIFIVETQSGRIKVMRPSADGSRAENISIYAQGMVQPLGMAFYPSAQNPEWLYVAEMNRVVRYPYQVGDTQARSVPEVVVPQLSPIGGGHYTRDLAFSPDGKRMYVSVGSQSNAAETENIMEKKTVAEAQAWEASRALGAAWGQEENRAAVLVFEVGNEVASARLFATGLRNCVGMSVQAETGDVWCAVNERDQLGDDLVPDYATRVPEGSFFGWPWYYMGDNEDPRLAGERPDLLGSVRRPDVPFTSHSAAVDIEFYPLQ
ncbi:MAG TPA: c-type cytochrome, partial [Pseudomonadaceae bacterium]|nr:c-type cytochrome [Pseudomonadaceae bacterium]